jgi:hypothetical protein
MASIYEIILGLLTSKKSINTNYLLPAHNEATPYDVPGIIFILMKYVPGSFAVMYVKIYGSNTFSTLITTIPNLPTA